MATRHGPAPDERPDRRRPPRRLHDRGAARKDLLRHGHGDRHGPDALPALGILALTLGLISGESAGDLRTLTATGATSRVRRTLTATPAAPSPTRRAPRRRRRLPRPHRHARRRPRLSQPRARPLPHPHAHR